MMVRALLVLGLTLAYATLRYNVFKGKPWEEWSVYVTNKAFGLSALLLIVWLLASYWRQRKLDQRLTSWISGFMLVHVFISLTILHRHYFPDYFTTPLGGGRGMGGGGAGFTTLAGISWMLGAVATAGVFMLLRRCTIVRPNVGLLGMWGAVVGLHAAVLGYAGWFTPWKWPGYMLPITLLSALAGVAALVLGVLGSRAERGPRVPTAV